MTEKEMLELEKYWCENCCNFDKGHIQMDGSAKCKLTGTMVYCKESGKECKCFNVPAENVIVPPCKVGDKVYKIPSETNYRLNIVNGFEQNNRVYEQTVCEVRIFANNKYLLSTCDYLQSVHSDFYKENWFLTKEEAEKALKEREG